jgi:hypothetical protein
LSRGDMIPCTEKGKAVRVAEETAEDGE